MKRLLCVLLALLLTACCAAAEETAADPITMLVTQGNNEAYFTALAEMLREDLGIETEFVYNLSRDTTSMTRLYFANNDLPADIVFTASKTDDALLKDCCVDLLARSAVTAAFTPTVVNECRTEEGAIYQLPVTSRLIGITYNETLMNEMGWDVPKTFDDMVALKVKCDEAGIKFAVADGIATGHGFNWLFHLMGPQFLSTLEGTAWLEGFQSGTTSVDDFAAACDYFRRWTEAGLWGSFHNQDWHGSQEFSHTRALFWYGLTNSVSGYEGPQYDDAGNETGVTLNDTYKSMPWISEDGSNNCYTYYDCCWVYVNKALEAPGQEAKLQNVFSILEYMVGERATALVSDISSDTYVAVNKYEMGEDRLYAAFADDIRNGFVQPWYYNEFDMDSIVFTGEKINAYIAGTGSFDEIFTTLDACNQNQLNAQTSTLATFTEKLDTENTAKLAAVSAAFALDKTLEENGKEERAEVAITPYATAETPMQPFRNASVNSSVIYEGALDTSMKLIVFPNGSTTAIGIRMTGAQIKALTEKGFDPSDRYINAQTGESTFDSENYGPYAYAVVVKGGAALEDEREYLVALSDRYISLADYSAFESEGKVLTDLENVHNLEDGLTLFCEPHPTIAASDLTW